MRSCRWAPVMGLVPSEGETEKCLSVSFALSLSLIPSLSPFLSLPPSLSPSLSFSLSLSLSLSPSLYVQHQVRRLFWCQGDSGLLAACSGTFSLQNAGAVTVCCVSPPSVCGLCLVPSPGRTFALPSPPPVSPPRCGPGRQLPPPRPGHRPAPHLRLPAPQESPGRAQPSPSCGGQSGHTCGSPRLTLVFIPASLLALQESRWGADRAPLSVKTGLPLPRLLCSNFDLWPCVCVSAGRAACCMFCVYVAACAVCVVCHVCVCCVLCVCCVCVLCVFALCRVCMLAVLYVMCVLCVVCHVCVCCVLCVGCVCVSCVSSSAVSQATLRRARLSLGCVPEVSSHILWGQDFHWSDPSGSHPAWPVLRPPGAEESPSGPQPRDQHLSDTLIPMCPGHKTPPRLFLPP